MNKGAREQLCENVAQFLKGNTKPDPNMQRMAGLSQEKLLHRYFSPDKLHKAQ